ncbi:MAG: type VI secretion system baseplate subunit TssF, partial [Gemmataceae bacterium]|nr:type VI secretion system baseplate subunit TssF [Gemmataceae bacterium]
AQTFLAGCTPVINLFDKSAEPLAVTQRTFEYRVVPSRTEPMGMEVMSVDSVTALDPGRGHIDMEPFYSRDFNATLARNETLARSASEGTLNRSASKGAGERTDSDPEDYAFWFAHRRASYVEEDRGTEVYLSLVDSGFEPRRPADAVLHIKTTCSNRDWPVRFQRGGEALYLEQDESPLALESRLPLARGEESLGPIVCLFQPTAPLRPPLRRSTYWRLLAQNNLNHASLCDPLDGGAALQEMLRLCNFAEPQIAPQLAAVNHEIIEGISAIHCRPILGRVSQGAQIGVCRGLEVTLEFDERRYVGVGAFLFACVLERYLAYYAGLNSFSQLIAKTKQAQGYFKKWPPRAADRPLR